MADLFTIRDANVSDMELINNYALMENMAELSGPENIRVAVNEDDVPVGFLRLQYEDGKAYVNPMVTYKEWRGYGVGRALIQDAHERAGTLYLVARGWSADFYYRMGCTPLSWNDIHPHIAADCDGCPVYEECKPQPLCLR